MWFNYVFSTVWDNSRHRRIRNIRPWTKGLQQDQFIVGFGLFIVFSDNKKIYRISSLIKNQINLHFDTVTLNHNGCKQTVSPSESSPKASTTTTPATMIP